MRRIKNKRADAGEMVVWIARLAILSVIVLAIAAISGFSYPYQVNTRGSEARVLSKVVSECVAPNGVLEEGRDFSDFLGECIRHGQISNRFYVSVKAFEEQKEILFIEQGDAGSLWVEKLFRSAATSKGIEQHKPGYYVLEIPSIKIKSGNQISEGSLRVEALVRNEA